MKIAKKQVRIIKKIREASGVWRFISLQRAGLRYVWDDRPGHYFLDWREGQKRKREYAGGTPSEAIEAQRRKRNELLGALISNGKTAPAAENESLLTVARAKEMFWIMSERIPLTNQRLPDVTSRCSATSSAYSDIRNKWRRLTEAT